MPDKIIRLTFKVGGDTFAIDRPFETDKTPQKNCEDSMTKFSDAIVQRMIIPGLRIEGEHGIPVLLNPSVFGAIEITQVQVLESKEAPRE